MFLASTAVRRFTSLRGDERAVLIAGVLAFTALAGWTCFAFSASSSRQLTQKLDTATTELRALAFKYETLQGTVGALGEVEAKLSAARVEHSRAVQAGVEASARLGLVQQELAVLTKRLEQARERTSHTGSIRQQEANKKAVR